MMEILKFWWLKLTVIIHNQKIQKIQKSLVWQNLMIKNQMEEALKALINYHQNDINLINNLKMAKKKISK